jgi:hypothetical protein
MPLSPVNLCPIYRHNLNCTTQFRHFATETSLVYESTVAAEECVSVLERASAVIAGRDFPSGISRNDRGRQHRLETIQKVVAAQHKCTLDIRIGVLLRG